MRNPVVITALLYCLIGGAALADSHTERSQPPQTGKADKPAIVMGCVSAGNGSFKLTDGSGTNYQLAGDETKFTEHIGHRVEITGTITPSSSGQSGSQSTLTVASIKQIASTCNSSQ
jgi:hypothetical protein